MEKYKTEFKLKVVKSFLAGDGGAKLLARQSIVPEEKIRTWVSHDRLHGIASPFHILLRITQDQGVYCAPINPPIFVPLPSHHAVYGL